MEAIESQDQLSLDGINEHKPRNFARMLALTAGLGGLQCIFCVEFSLASLHLISLGIPKSTTALIWLSSPIAGIIAQPYFGTWSDNLRSEWGRRRPFILAGTAVTIISLLSFAWIETIVTKAFWLLKLNSEGQKFYVALVVCATICVLMLNIAIQAIQCGMRALIVDKCSAHEQAKASAYASCMIGVGNMFSYFVGSLDLSKITHTSFDETQIKAMSFIASLVLCLSTGVTCASTNETNNDVFPFQKIPKLTKESLFARHKQIFTAVLTISQTVRRVCVAQLFAWFGWFIFLTYNTLYTEQIYISGSSTINSHNQLTTAVSAKRAASRLSSVALLSFAIASFLVNVVLLLIFTRIRSNQKSSYLDVTDNRNRSLTRTLWTYSQVFFAVCMFATVFITDALPATIMVTLVGISWAVSNWAPFSLVATEVASQLTGDNGAGISFGLLNVAICLPQVLVVIVSSIQFRFFTSSSLSTTDYRGYGIVWLFCSGGISSLVAAYHITRINRN
ncbi:major facilitator superfamily domain-containing protein [Xylogone sp. PMI_703]|nr:major facilitator superfamily domain-containing protein [Xylogone sp. PMI_703]